MSGKKIKKMLIDKDMTIKALSDLTGFTSAYLSRVIHGHAVSERAIRSIAFALGVNVEDIRPHKLPGMEVRV